MQERTGKQYKHARWTTACEVACSLTTQVYLAQVATTCVLKGMLDLTSSPRQNCGGVNTTHTPTRIHMHQDGGDVPDFYVSSVLLMRVSDGAIGVVFVLSSNTDCVFYVTRERRDVAVNCPQPCRPSPGNRR